ncbi:hypothetical protein HBI56_084180 [Parastagonospora nodorum]|nr:hypothetical protein HBH56_102370 [Parastagonospora nodorum]KAH3929145.1 hypothetical protein HBH54_128040 [Parastagonospora nodorum]KAH3951385.1 hypothetical protein HBH53_062050 [Parastagonospora nodorum]KAH3975696.1 hypothetical protein HBH52_124810 [Parastagonospora nodorum]KAH3978703.1 hypothetical protein HBH51_061760 [Parastagonospora nodorum]
MPICDSQQTRFWDPITGFSPFSLSLSCLGAGGSWCPGIIWTDATPKCCGPNSNMMLCPGGTCQDSGGDSSAYSCPPVMLSSEAPAPILTPVPTVTEVSAFLTSAAPSFVSPSLAPAPQSATARTCPGGLLCGNDTFCSIDNKNCCPQFEGQTYCPGAGICFRPSVGDQCCSDKICYSPQICAPGGYV